MESVYIVNPRAGRGRGALIARDLSSLLHEQGLSGRVETTSAPKDAVRIAASVAREGMLVVAVGGDGTANEVVNGLAGSEATFGLIPVGSGNDLAMALGIPSHLESALEVIRTGRETRIDLGHFEGGWFANSLGIGFEAQVTIESRKVKHLRGFAVYLWAVIKALGRLRCAEYLIRTNDTEIRGRRLLICVGNGPRVGGGFLLTPDAENTDGELDVCVVASMGRWAVLKTLPKAIRGRHTHLASVSMLRTQSLELESEEGFPFHADGEVVDENRNRLRIEIHPRLLKVRCP